jgi:hypothetical protein
LGVRESGVPAARIEVVEQEIGRAGGAVSTNVWRNAAAGNLWGWEVARALELLVVLAGAVGTPGGTTPSGFHKAVPAPPMMPPPAKVWSELLMPREYPLAFFEMSFLLPHMLREGRGKLAMYFTRVYNPVWTNPDGMSWIEMLTDEAKVERHACLTPIWSETAHFADYVLPMGHASERHDLMSQETHAARWIGFRQPVLRVALERQGKRFDWTWQAHEAAGLGQVWEEDEFWIELSWRIDPDGSLGIRKYFESPYRPGEKLRIEEFYRWIFESSVPGLPAAASKEGLTPLEYMRKYCAFLVEAAVYGAHEKALTAAEPPALRWIRDPVVAKGGAAVGVESTAAPRASRRRRGSSSSTRRPSGTGSGPSTRCRPTSEATSTGRGSTGRGASTCCSPRSGCRPSFTRAPATPSGCTKSRIATPSGCTRRTRRGSAWRRAASSRSRPRSATSWTVSG